MSSSNDVEIPTRPDSTLTTTTVGTTNDLTVNTKPAETIIITTTTTTTETSNNKLDGNKDIETIDMIDSGNKKMTTTTLTITPIILNGENGNSKSQHQQEQQPQIESQPQFINQIELTTTTTDKMDHHGDLINFKVLYVLAQLCGLTLIVMMGTWVGVYMGGVSWRENPSKEFFWHPLLMTIGLIYLYGNGILIYRGFRTCRKKGLKLTHAGIHMGAFILTVIGLVAVFDSHNLATNPIPNMYTLHSWLGLSAVILFSLQYVFGFVMFLAPGAKDSLKVAFMPLHIYFGLFGFVLAAASALMGLTEKAIWEFKDTYVLLPPSAVMVNIMGVLYVVFASLVVFLATESSYKRKPVPEDTQLLTGANE